MVDFNPDMAQRAQRRFTELGDDVEAAITWAVTTGDKSAGGGLVGAILDDHDRNQQTLIQTLYTAQNIYRDFAEDYEQTYAAYRRGELDNVERLRRIWSEMPPDENPPKPYNYPPDWHPPGVLGTDLPSSHLGVPQPPDTSILVMDVVDSIVNRDADRHALSELFKEVFTFVTGTDFDAVLDDVFRQVVGDWRKVGILADTYRNYGRYYGSAGLCVRDDSAVVFASWDGPAADVARSQLQEFGLRLFLTESDLNDAANRFLAACLGVYGLLADLSKALDDLMGASSEVDRFLMVETDKPLPVIIGQVAGLVLTALDELFEVAHIVLLIAETVKVLLEILAVLQAALLEFTNRLPSTA